LYVCGTYIPLKKSKYFENEIFEELENDIILFSSRGNILLLGDLNARTSKLEDFVSRDGSDHIQDTSDNSFQPPERQNFDSTFKNSLIIHEENTKKNHKRVVSLYVDKDFLSFT
jgi:hypothetical protein